MTYFDSCGTRFSSLIQSRRLLSAAHNASRMVKFMSHHGVTMHHGAGGRHQGTRLGRCQDKPAGL